MRIFAIIFFALLLLKLKVHIIFIQNQLDGIIKIRIGFFKIQKKISIIAREKKYIHKKKRKHKFKEVWDVMKKTITVQKLSLNIRIGLFYMPLTIAIIPLLSTVLETLKYQKIKKYKYVVLPIFGDKFALMSEVDLSFNIRICDLLYLYVYSRV